MNFFKLDEKYKKIVHAVILSFIAIYCLMYAIDFVVVLISNASEATGKITEFISTLISIFLPVVLAFVLAFLCDPIVEKFQVVYENKKGVKIKDDKFRVRGVGTLVLYIILFGIIIFGLYSILGGFNFSSSTNLIVSIQNSIVKSISSIEELYNAMTVWLTEVGLIGYFEGVLEAIFSFASGLLTNLVGIIAKVGSGVFTFFMALILGFYFLKDKEEFLYKTNIVFGTFMPEKAFNKSKEVIKGVNYIFSGYIRGQITDAFIVGTLLSVLLSIVGVPFAVPIGIISGFSNLIPYVGAFVAYVLAIVSALFGGDVVTAVLASAVILVVQILDSVVIVPNVVGKNVELSPFVVLVALSVSGSLFGIFGMVFAVPVTAMLKIIITGFIERQRESQKIKNALTLKKNKSES
ncbi:MAG: AI-2E family transporter [Lachnospirales bacterium]